MTEKSPKDNIIGKIRQKQKLDTLIHHLKKMLAEDIRSKHKMDIFRAISQLDASTPDLLIPLLCDPDQEVSSKFALYLITSGDESLEALKGALKNPDQKIRRKAMDILGKIHSAKALAILIDFWVEDNEQAMSIVDKLKKIGSKCVPALIKAFDISNPAARSYIAYALWSIGDKRATEKLLAFLADGDPDTCGTVAIALGRKNDALAARVLIEALQKNGKRIADYKNAGNPKSFVYTGVQAHIAAALVKTEAVAIPMLVQRMKKVANMETYKSIISILGKIGGQEAIAPLISLAICHEKIDDKLLLEVLAAMENAKDPCCISVLSKILQSKGKKRKIYENAVRALQVIKTEKAGQVLMGSLQNREASIRFYATLALEKRECYQAIPHLLSLLQDSSPLVAARAMATLEKFAAKTLPILFEQIDQNSGDIPKSRDLIKRIGKRSLKHLQNNDKQEKDDKEKAIEALHLIIFRASDKP